MIIKSIQINDNNISIAYQKPSATGLLSLSMVKSKVLLIRFVLKA